MGEVGVGGPVELRHRHEVVAGAETRLSTDMLTAAAPELTAIAAAPPSSAVMPLLEHVHRGIVDAVVVEPRRLEVHDRRRRGRRR